MPATPAFNRPVGRALAAVVATAVIGSLVVVGFGDDSSAGEATAGSRTAVAAPAESLIDARAVISLEVGELRELSERARLWAAARDRARLEAIAAAEADALATELAAAEAGAAASSRALGEAAEEEQQLAAEEQARIEAEEAARQRAEEEARRQADEAPPPSPAPAPQPAPEPDPVPEGDPAPDPDPAPEGDPVPEGDPAPEGDPVPEGDPAPDDPEEQPDEEPAPDPEPDPEPSGPTPEQWEQLRQCESGGNYSIDTGNGFYGAYQFAIATWDWLAGLSFPDLVGVLPSDATPAQQDAMAFQLYALNGAAPWPVCGQHLL